MPNDSLIDKDGVVHEKGWDGQYHPKQGLFGQQQDKNWVGQPNVERDWLGNPKEERDWLGNPVRSKSGDTLYQPSGGGGGGFSGPDLSGDLATVVVGFIVWLAFAILFGLLWLVWQIVKWIHRELYAQYGDKAFLYEFIGYGVLGIVLLVFISLASATNNSGNYTYAAPNYLSTSVPTVVRLPTPTPRGFSSGSQRAPTLIPGNTSAPQGSVNANPLILREGPGTDYRSLDRLPQGTVVEILVRNSNGEWFKVSVPSKSEQGWVAAKYIDSNIAPSSIPVADSVPPAPIVPTQIPRQVSTATPLPPAGVKIDYYAEQEFLSHGNCTVIHWGIENVQAIYLNGEGVQGWDERKVCLNTTTTYTLRIILNDGNSIERNVIIKVQ